MTILLLFLIAMANTTARPGMTALFRCLTNMLSGEGSAGNSVFVSDRGELHDIPSLSRMTSFCFEIIAELW